MDNKETVMLSRDGNYDLAYQPSILFHLPAVWLQTHLRFQRRKS